MEIQNIKNSAKVVINRPSNYSNETHKELLNEFDEDLVNGVMEYFSGDTDQSYEALTDCYEGEFDDFLDYVTQATKEIHFTDEIPKIFKDFFDFKKLKHDMDCEGLHYDVYVNKKCHVFRVPVC